MVQYINTRYDSYMRAAIPAALMCSRYYCVRVRRCDFKHKFWVGDLNKIPKGNSERGVGHSRGITSHQDWCKDIGVQSYAGMKRVGENTGYRSWGDHESSKPLLELSTPMFLGRCCRRCCWCWYEDDDDDDNVDGDDECDDIADGDDEDYDNDLGIINSFLKDMWLALCLV